MLAKQWLHDVLFPRQRRTVGEVKAPLIPETHITAAQGLVDFDLLKTVDHRNKLVRTSYEGSHPDIVRFYKKFSSELEKRGFPFFAIEFYRSHERQNILYKQKVSNAKGGQSPHNFGLAVDIVHSKHFWEISKKQWAVIGLIGKEAARKIDVKVEWGGDFKSLWDPAHWQLSDWKDLRKT